MRHLEEGEIHAWLDGATGADEFARIEAHVATCPGCSAAVAEARGLIAGASRILLALDAVPGGVVPPRDTGVETLVRDHKAATRQTQRRHVPWFARRPIQIAAGLMLAVGIGSVATRDAGRAPQQVTVDLETTAPVPGEADAAGNRESARETIELRVDEAATADPRNTERPPSGAVAAPRVADRAREESSPPVAQAAAVPVAPPSMAGKVVDSARARLEASAVRQDRVAAGLAGGADSSTRGTISGRVVTTGNAPVGEAIVTVPGSGIGARTNADGTFTLPPLPPGSYTIEARRLGLGPARLDGVQLAAGDTAHTRLALPESVLELSGIAVSSAASSDALVAQSCYSLDAEANAESRGVPVVPRRIRIRLMASPEPARDRAANERVAAAGVAGGVARDVGVGQARRVVPAPMEPTSEPLTPLPWTRVGADSIVVTWARTTDVVTLRLALRGAEVEGTATTNTSAARSATVSGRKVDCGGGR